MVFGVFDGIHDGHREMLKQAKGLGDFLIVVVAPNHIVEELKGHKPNIDLVERCVRLKALKWVDEVVTGDKENGTWDVVKKHQPDIIALGYDQTELKANLESSLDIHNHKFKVMMLDAYQPNVLHSSKIKL